MKRIMGYSDQISVCPDDTIRFMVNCEAAGDYSARIVRVIHGDTNPDGPGYKEEAIETAVTGRYPARRQAIHAGSCAVVPDHAFLAALGSFTVQALVWPTTPAKGRQGLAGRWNGRTGAGFALGIDEGGGLALRLGDGRGGVAEVAAGKPMLAREWYFVAASYDAATGAVSLYQEPLVPYARTDTAVAISAPVALRLPANVQAPVVFAARHAGVAGKRTLFAEHFNGKIDRPRLANRVLSRLEMEQVRGDLIPVALQSSMLGVWNFSKCISSETIWDDSPNRLHGETFNLPARAMTGHNWTGEEMAWTHKPEQYGAIHFHDDDLHDAGWEVDFALKVPAGLKSGVYAAHVAIDDDEDFIPFVIRPPRGTASSKLLFVLPTASYLAYANEHMVTDAPLAELLTGQVSTMQPADMFLNEHREYGLSCYDSHSDGSGVCYTTRLRPIITMRPKYQSWLGGKGSGLWQMNADLHITDWLEAEKLGYDVITDEDVHAEGYTALAPYSVFVTSTHHEYWTKQMWDALDAFKKHGGRLVYTGANAWYWRIAYHPTRPGVMEVRRAEGGIRAWAAEPGEAYHSFSGEYGGLWRRNGLAPQRMAGSGFTAQGFDISSYYRRKPDSYDPRARFIFEGVGAEELIGDFGLIGGGAAGLELDRADRVLGTAPNALVLASSENHTGVYMVVLEEIYINSPGLCGGESDLVRADLVFYETPAGGAVFATSSIAWAGSLSHNNYNNNVARITGNVIRRFLDPAPF